MRDPHRAPIQTMLHMRFQRVDRRLAVADDAAGETVDRAHPAQMLLRPLRPGKFGMAERDHVMDQGDELRTLRPQYRADLRMIVQMVRRHLK
ncbi:hypothetical protein LTR94_036806, partial [Friedmanniomyces endolithicus]